MGKRSREQHEAAFESYTSDATNSPLQAPACLEPPHKHDAIIVDAHVDVAVRERRHQFANFRCREVLLRYAQHCLPLPGLLVR